MRIPLIFLVILSLAVFTVSAISLQAVDVIPSNNHASITIPGHAIEVAPGVFSLGQARDVDGRIVEGFMFVDYRKENAKPGTECGNGICEQGENAKKCPADCGGGEEPTDSTCFAYLGKGTKWKTVEPYLVDPTNNAGLSTTFIRSNLASDIDQWEDAADGSVDGVQGADILGDENLGGTVNRATIGDLNGENEVMFADISGGAIAVTIVWGIFRGPPNGRELVEWDQVYDDADFNWSATGEAGKMDFWNIAQHELGHSVGLGHPNDDCTEETMFRFASSGETNKRSLNDGDITGVKKLYS